MFNATNYIIWMKCVKLKNIHQSRFCEYSKAILTTCVFLFSLNTPGTSYVTFLAKRSEKNSRCMLIYFFIISGQSRIQMVFTLSWNYLTLYLFITNTPFHSLKTVQICLALCQVRMAKPVCFSFQRRRQEITGTILTCFAHAVPPA